MSLFVVVTCSLDVLVPAKYLEERLFEDFFFFRLGEKDGNGIFLIIKPHQAPLLKMENVCSSTVKQGVV